MRSNHVGFRNSDTLTAWVRYMLYAHIIIGLVSMASGYLEYNLLSDYQNGTYTSQEQAVADGQASDQRQKIIGIIYIIIYVVSGFLILRWIHRANYNARQLGAENMKFSPGWSIGFYFIPILTLWKPYQAMKEIWKASKEPSDWQSQKTSDILTLWWILWLISNFLGQTIFKRAVGAEELEELMDLNLITQVSDATNICLALVLLSIVNKVYNFQMRHLETVSNNLADRRPV